MSSEPTLFAVTKDQAAPAILPCALTVTLHIDAVTLFSFFYSCGLSLSPQNTEKKQSQQGSEWAVSRAHAFLHTGPWPLSVHCCWADSSCTINMQHIQGCDLEVSCGLDVVCVNSKCQSPGATVAILRGSGVVPLENGAYREGGLGVTGDTHLEGNNIVIRDPSCLLASSLTA